MILIAFFASMGLPGFSGFIAEIMVFLGAFKSHSVNGPLHESLAIIATLGLIIGAAYYLWTLQRMFFGPFHLKGSYTADADEGSHQARIHHAYSTGCCYIDLWHLSTACHEHYRSICKTFC